ncbi:hypothetical protein [Glaciimonas sp. PCH181]|uniref:hypothetical protein n=1 Tax=Glaciimonas sp. PCH181 TaxID=2133943 RepID=UPI000D3AE030|nr:hypothetical protein [Glaciimonas sp. PCH181]PUA19567.1 hypothetical protein C7W93_06900 [Glaciimonas sp. PCH181]
MDAPRETILGMSEQQFREFMYDQLMAGKEQFTQLHDALATNTEMTKATITSTAELVEIFKAAKTGVSVFAWSGRNLRKFVTFIYPFALLGGTIAAIWHGKWPKWGD